MTANQGGVGERADVPRLLVRVQHHPSRAGAPLERLLRSLDALDVEVVADDPDGPRSAWRTHRRCLLTPLPDRVSHLLVVQDDTYAAVGIADALAAVVAAHPDRIIATFLAGSPVQTARKAQRAHRLGQRYVEITHEQGREFVPTVATLWPRADLTALADWLAAGNEPPPEKRDDDPVIGTFCRNTGRRVLVPVPSLIQHPDDVPSTIGRPHRQGRNPYRVAAVFAEDLRGIDWTTP